MLTSRRERQEARICLHTVTHYEIKSARSTLGSATSYRCVLANKTRESVLGPTYMTCRMIETRPSELANTL
jgi:hypothetical protein